MVDVHFDSQSFCFFIYDGNSRYMIDVEEGSYKKFSKKGKLLEDGSVKGLLNIHRVLDKLENRKGELLKKAEEYKKLGDSYKLIGDELLKKVKKVSKKPHLK